MSNQTVTQMVGQAKLNLFALSNNPELFKKIVHKDTVISVSVTFVTCEAETVSCEAYLEDLEWESHCPETGELLEIK